MKHNIYFFIILTLFLLLPHWGFGFSFDHFDPNAKIATLENDQNLISWPESCYLDPFFVREDAQKRCALQTHPSKKYTLKKPGLLVVLSENTVVRFRGKSLRLVKGELLVIENQSFVVSTLQVDDVTSESPFLVSYLEEKTTITAFHSYVEFRTKDNNEKLTVLPGAFMEVGQMELHGYLKEFPRISDYKKVIHKLARLYPFSKKDFALFIEVYKNNWKISLKKIKDLYHKNAQRLIETQKKRDQSLRLARKRKLQQERSLQRLFMKKNYIFSQ